MLYHRLIQRAELTARKVSISRHQLFSAAILEFLKCRRNNKITAQLNQVYCQEPATLDPVLEYAQAESLKATDWR
jgi:hypothetical protein